MNETYTPPDYLSFTQLFEKVGDTLGLKDISSALLRLEKKQLFVAEEVDAVYVTYISDANVEKIETILSDPSKQNGVTITTEVAELRYNKNNISIKNKELEFIKIENEKYIFIDRSFKECILLSDQLREWTKSELSLAVAKAKTQNYIRNKMCSSAISAFIIHNANKYSLPHHMWEDPFNWFMLLRMCNNFYIPRQYIYPSKKTTECDVTVKDWLQNPIDKDLTQIINKILFDKDETLKVCLEQHAKLIPASKLLLECLEKIEKGQLKLRAAEILLFTAKNYFSDQDIKRKTINTLTKEIEKLAKDNKFVVLENQAKLANTRKEDSNFEANCISKADIAAIATLLRDLSLQLGPRSTLNPQKNKSMVSP